MTKLNLSSFATSMDFVFVLDAHNQTRVGWQEAKNVTLPYIEENRRSTM
jgi:hypothetical protein